MTSRVLQAVEQMEIAETQEAFIKATIAAAEVCFPGSMIAYHDVKVGATADVSRHQSSDPRVDDAVVCAWQKHALSSPVVQYYLAGGRDPIVSTENLVSDVALRDTALYADCWKPFGVKYQIGLRLWSNKWVGGLSIKRDRRFSDTEKGVARTLYTFFFRSYQRQLAEEIGRSERAELLFDQDDRLLVSSKGWPPEIDGSNDARVIECIRARLQTTAVDHDRERTTFSVDGLECSAQPLSGRLVRVAVSVPRGRGVGSFARLTMREQEILTWIYRGKRDAEIGVILGIAARTVSKHVEHILAKLEVETRTAAATVAPDYFGRSGRSVRWLRGSS